METISTPFAAVYDAFFSKITDDMYVELTPQDTLRDLQTLLIDALPGFELIIVNPSTATLSDSILMTESNNFALSDFRIAGWFKIILLLLKLPLNISS